MVRLRKNERFPCEKNSLFRVSSTTLSSKIPLSHLQVDRDMEIRNLCEDIEGRDKTGLSKNPFKL